MQSSTVNTGLGFVPFNFSPVFLKEDPDFSKCYLHMGPYSVTLTQSLLRMPSPQGPVFSLECPLFGNACFSAFLGAPPSPCCSAQGLVSVWWLLCFDSHLVFACLFPQLHLQLGLPSGALYLLWSVSLAPSSPFMASQGYISRVRKGKKQPPSFYLVLDFFSALSHIWPLQQPCVKWEQIFLLSFY